MNNLYKILGISKKVKNATIKKVYRKLAMEYHPDKNGGKESEEFLQITLAYKVLSDSALRKDYDETGNIPDIKPVQDPFKMAVLSRLGPLLEQALSKYNITDIKSNLPDILLELLNNSEVQLRENLAKLRKEIKTNQEITEMIKNEDSPFLAYLHSQITAKQHLERELSINEIKYIEEIRKIIKDMDFKAVLSEWKFNINSTSFAQGIRLR